MILAWAVLEKFPQEPSEAVKSTYFWIFPYSFRPEVGNDVISGIVVESVGLDVPVKFGDSVSNGFRDIRGADFERTNIGEAYPNSATDVRDWLYLSIEQSYQLIKESTDGTILDPLHPTAPLFHKLGVEKSPFRLLAKWLEIDEQCHSLHST